MVKEQIILNINFPMPNLKNHKVVYVNEGARPSRFLVDLLRANEPKIEPEKGALEKFLLLFKKKEKKPENIFKDFFNWFDRIINKHKKEFLQTESRGEQAEKTAKNNFRKKLNKVFHKQEERIKRLAFFPLFKVFFILISKIFKGIYKICFWFGWIFIFLIRFAGIFTFRLPELFFNIFSFNKKNQVIEEIVDNIEATKEPIASEVKTKKSFFSILGMEKNDFFCHFVAKRRNPLNANTPCLRDFSPRAARFEMTKKGFSQFSIFKKSKQTEKKDKKKEWKKIRFFQIFPAPLRPLLNFVLILIAIILPLKAFTAIKGISDLKLRVIDATYAAIGDIKSASFSAADKDFSEAGKNFSLASKNFLEAKKEIADLSLLLNIAGAIITNDDIKLAKNADAILEAGRLSSDIGMDLSAALVVFNQNELSLKQILDSLAAKSENLILNTALLKEAIKKIDAGALPPEYQNTFLALQGKADSANNSIKEFFEIIKLARVFLGFEQDKRYLFVFQNNTELRASGGFIGSYAIVDFRNGEIIKMDVPGGGSYETEGGLRERIIAPQPLALINPLWHFWDANWWPDWPISAAKLAWFYEKSGGSTVDGVISFTPTVMERLLKIIGPLDMTEKYSVTINAENFWQIVQVMSEQKPEYHPDHARYARLRDEITQGLDSADKVQATLSAAMPASADKTATASEEILANAASTQAAPKAERHEPKLIIGDMLEKIQIELKNKLNKETFFSLVGLTLNSLNEKHILFYSNDEYLQAKADNYDWTGKMKSADWDYLMVVDTNIAGAKTDRVIAEEIKHKAEVGDDGTITDTVEIIRRHQGIKGDAFTGVRNVDWLRIYVPLGSRLVSASGFRVPDEKYFAQPEADWRADEYVTATEGQAVIDKNSGTKIYSEAGKTVFANWCMADPGETIVIHFKYVLPFKMAVSGRADDLKAKFMDFMNPGQKKLIPYALMAQKQPGTLGSKFTSDLILPDKFKTVWQYGGENESSSGWQYDSDLTVDRYWAVLAEE